MKNYIKAILLIILCLTVNACYSVIADYESTARDKNIQVVLAKIHKGIMVETKTETIFSQQGSSIKAVAVVTYIRPGSEADQAGIQVGDQITAVNNDMPYYDNDLISRLCSSEDNMVNITILRYGKEIKTSMKSF